jgi:hypothetical protein
MVVIDQNSLPRHSLGEDWGKNNLAKAYVAMKNFQMLPLDTSITNTENPLAFQHYQKLDLEQSNRLMTRIQLANYFKQQAFEVIGITPQRMGQQIGQTNTATGVEQAVSGSYAQTEMLFVQHSDYLMPRVHQMRTDLAQHYHSTKPSLRLRYITNTEETKNFEMNGTDLLMRDLNIFCTTKANHRAVLEQLKQLAIQNNTSGASIYDLGNIMKAESIAEVDQILKKSDERMERQRQEQMQQEQQMQEQTIKAKQDETRQKMEFEASENQKDREARIVEAEIKAAGYGSMQDMNQNMQSDYADMLEKIQKGDEYQQTMGLQREKEGNRMRNEAAKMDMEREKLAVQKQISDNQLAIAMENKNKFDIKKKASENKKK